MRSGQVAVMLDLGDLGEVEFRVVYNYYSSKGDRWTPGYDEVDIERIESDKPGLSITEKTLSKDILELINEKIMDDVYAQIEEQKIVRAEYENERFAMYREVE